MIKIDVSTIDDDNVYPDGNIEFDFELDGSSEGSLELVDEPIVVTRIDFKNDQNENVEGVFKANEKKFKAVVYFLGHLDSKGKFVWTDSKNHQFSREFSFGSGTSVETFHVPDASFCPGDCSLAVEISGKIVYREPFKVLQGRTPASSALTVVPQNIVLPSASNGGDVSVSRVEFFDEKDKVVAGVYQSNGKRLKAVVHFGEVPAGTKGCLYWRAEKTAGGPNDFQGSKYDFSFVNKTKNTWVESFYETDGGGFCPGDYYVLIEANGRTLHKQPFKVVQGPIAVSRVEFKNGSDKVVKGVFKTGEKQVKAVVFFSDLPEGTKGTFFWRVEKTDKKTAAAGVTAGMDLARHDYCIAAWTPNARYETFCETADGFLPGEYSLVIELNGKVMHKEPFKVK